jgi:hypothetical protein
VRSEKMAKLYYEWGTKQLFKHGEELCGDAIAISSRPESVTMALSDGLGSGVKANILATLTTRIAIQMLENDLSLGEVVQTLGETLPLDTVRKLAYSTFAIAQISRQGYARVVEFDSPSAILLRRRKVQPLVYEERSIENKVISETVMDLEFGDWIIFVSDGVLNAGIGGVYPLGWGWDQAAHFMEGAAHPELSAEELAEKIAATVSELYAGAPGDDVSIIVIKCRRKLVATVFTGPPANKSEDKEVIHRFLNGAGKLAVCGGTTAKIVARHSGHPIEVDLSTMTGEVPPMARINGVDLVCEGILTLTRVRSMLEKGTEKKAVQFKTDGAANLLRLLLEVDHIHFIVGQAINPAHQNPELPHQLDIRQGVVREIAELLRGRGKEVTIETV